MRLSVVTFGSEGDTRPLAALCHGLKGRGHEVKLFADGATLAMPRALHLPCEALEGDVREVMPIGDPRKALRLSDVMTIPRKLKAIIARNSASWLRRIAEHARESDAVLFSSLALGIGLTLRETLQKVAIGLYFQPITPTGAFNSVMLPPLRLPGWLNLWTHRVYQRQMWSLFAPSAREAALEVFGSSIRVRPPFDFPVLYGISRHFVPQPDDWPPDHLICGHWACPMSDWTAPEELLKFMKGGPPLYAGFGSPSAFVRSKRLGALTAAAAGRPVIFSPGWSEIDRALLPDNFFLARDVPHEWLFPRVSAVIHHGGAGTTHTAARAGIPQVVLPFGADQLLWARRVADLGIGPRTNRRDAEDPARVAMRLEEAHGHTVRRQVASLATAMSEEDGVSQAILEIERIVQRGGRRRVLEGLARRVKRY